MTVLANEVAPPNGSRRVVPRAATLLNGSPSIQSTSKRGPIPSWNRAFDFSGMRLHASGHADCPELANVARETIGNQSKMTSTSMISDDEFEIDDCSQTGTSQRIVCGTIRQTST